MRRMQSGGYKLVQLASGVHSVHSLEHGETFHPVVGPVAEAEALYVRQLRLMERLRRHHGEFVIWDVGLGAAANVLVALRAIRGRNGSVRIVSFDQTTGPLEFGLEHADQLGYFSGYEEHLRQLLRRDRVAFSDSKRSVNWELHIADFPALLQRWAGRRGPRPVPAPHVILFDAFSPATNPAMWTLSLFTHLYALLDPRRPCAMPTYSRSTLLRVTLLLAGFHVGAGHATGEKEETTIAANTARLIEAPLDRKWLERARRSTSAEPLSEPVYRQARLAPATWERLRAHPQFQ
jgi:tRNA U34 5-methylaminomethyl-2-thiouridine-forming methyltransferase MnmC